MNSELTDTLKSKKTEVIEVTDFSNSDTRKIIWRKTTTSVGLVTSEKNGKENVMACEWAFQVSINPPNYAIIIGKKKATTEFILHSMEFGLTFISDEQATQSHIAGSYSAYELDKIDTGLFPLRKGKHIKAPVLTEGLLAIECKVIEVIERENSYMFIGEALYAEYRNDKSPILYHAGKYFKLGEQIPKPELNLN